MVLEKINQVNDIKKIPPEEYEQLAEEIRQFLITKISQTGGHLASNLEWWSLRWHSIFVLIFRRIKSYGMWAISPTRISS